MVMNAYAIPGIKNELRVHIKRIEAFEIIKIICDYFDVSYDVIRSNSRKKHIVYVRDFAIYALREHTMLSLKETGKLFNRDHTTAIHATVKVKANLMDDVYTFHERYLYDYGEILRRLNKTL